MRLSQHQRLYLQTVFDYFRRESRWPTYWEVGRQLVHTMDVEEVAKSLPPGFTNADSCAGWLARPCKLRSQIEEGRLLTWGQ